MSVLLTLRIAYPARQHSTASSNGSNGASNTSTSQNLRPMRMRCGCYAKIKNRTRKVTKGFF